MAQRRFRLRVWMLLVLVAAVAVWCGSLRLRADEYRRRAAYHGQLRAAINTALSSSGEGDCYAVQLIPVAIGPPNGDPMLARRRPRLAWSRLFVYESELEQKYRYAASRPWLPVAPDSPPPPDPPPEPE